jgi:hypothetical protein
LGGGVLCDGGKGSSPKISSNYIGENRDGSAVGKGLATGRIAMGAVCRETDSRGKDEVLRLLKDKGVLRLPKQLDTTPKKTEY